MEELISCIVVKVGVDEGVVKDGLGIILGFLEKEVLVEKM